jgi:hypothetical protein
MLQIELDINFGLPNPRWSLTEEEERSLVERVLASPTVLSGISNNQHHLAFRGFVLRLISPEGPWAEQVRQECLPLVCRVNAGSDQSLINFLVETSVKPDVGINDYLREILIIPYPSDILIQKPLLDTAPQGVLPVCCVSTFLSGDDFSFWNERSHVLANNCYCYGSNKRIDRFAIPGAISGRSLKLPVNKADVTDALKADGWKLSCAPKNNLDIALVIMPPHRTRLIGDFHFYRLIKTSPYTWGHKPGQLDATNVDYSRRTITDPEVCDRRTILPSGDVWEYSEFGGYFFRDNYGFTVS